jgi:selenocysteine lyase/cysteine desulfurase
LFLVDAAQTAGVLPIDVKAMNIDLLAFPGHKGLLGPQGTGGLYIGPSVNMDTIKEGGTGSESANSQQPEMLPDRYGSGTLNTSGVAGHLCFRITHAPVERKQYGMDVDRNVAARNFKSESGAGCRNSQEWKGKCDS